MDRFHVSVGVSFKFENLLLLLLPFSVSVQSFKCLSRLSFFFERDRLSGSAFLGRFRSLRCQFIVVGFS